MSWTTPDRSSASKMSGSAAAAVVVVEAAVVVVVAEAVVAVVEVVTWPFSLETFSLWTGRWFRWLRWRRLPIRDRDLRLLLWHLKIFRWKIESVFHFEPI